MDSDGMNTRPVSPEETESWDSDPAGMMEYYKNQPYTLGQSIADIVDNSYDANATRIEVEILFDSSSEDKPYIVIFDDGDGISDEEMKSALRLGVRRNRSETELGVFGIGMKLSSLAQANERKPSIRKRTETLQFDESRQATSQSTTQRKCSFHSGSFAFEVVRTNHRGNCRP